MNVSIKHGAGLAIMNILTRGGVRMPAELGRGEHAEKFDDIERIYIDEQILKTRKLMMSYSTKVGKEILFGSSDNWEELVDSKTSTKFHDMIDPDLPFKMKIDDDHREGLYYTLLLMAHPSSQIAQPVAVLEEIVYPTAHAIGAYKQLAKHLKLDQKKGRKLSWDDNKEWDRKESRKLELVDEPEKNQAETVKKADA